MNNIFIAKCPYSTTNQTISKDNIATLITGCRIAYIVEVDGGISPTNIKPSKKAMDIYKEAITIFHQYSLSTQRATYYSCTTATQCQRHDYTLQSLMGL